MQQDVGSKFIRDNFEPEDRLAVVLIDRGSAAVTQRIASARQIASPQFQAWLKNENRAGRDVFISMNALNAQARGRTRGDVAAIRHLYLDFDDNGTQAVERLRAREDMPEPNYLVNTSPDHWQVSWKVQGFGKEQAEEMMRAMVREFGADPAATDYITSPADSWICESQTIRAYGPNGATFDRHLYSRSLPTLRTRRPPDCAGG